MSGGRSTLRRMMVSGSDRPMTAIMNASTVPSAAPLASSAWTTGMMPAAFEYIGMPTSTASGTAHQAPFPMMLAMNCSGTYPWMPAPTAMPASTQGQTRPTMSTTASAPARRRSAQDDGASAPSAAAACIWKTHGST